MDDEEFTEEDLAGIDLEVEKFNKKINSNYIESFGTQFDLSEEFGDNINEPALEHLECLKSKFAHNAFRHKQWEIIRAVMCERRDVCAVMATGYGKSLCFQFPAVFKNGITLVISPLIALMEAQVYTLNEARISACLLGSAQTDKNILQRIERSEFSIIHCCPEYLQSSNGPNLLNSLKDRLTLIAIDEAHSISQWGHDFRKDYRKLTIIRDIIPDVPILAVTATATENVRDDIISMLNLDAPRIIVSSFDRPNLEFIVNRKSSIWQDLGQWVQNVDGSVIIYVLSRKKTVQIAEKIAEHGIESKVYHAGLEYDVRADIVKKFIKNEVKIIVTTIAFGMGIDKPDIRCVIHYGASKNLEGYYQEVGRAGRDGLPAKVVTYFNTRDFDIHELFLRFQNDDKKLSKFVLNYLRGLGAKMRDYLYSTKCRRKTILEYFDEDTTSYAPRPNCCDNCTQGLSEWRLSDLYEGVDDNGFHDFSEDSKILLLAIQCLIQNGISTDKNRIKNFLTKRFDELLRPVTRKPLYGSGRMRPTQYWVALIEQLFLENFIEMIPDTKFLTVSQCGHQWLNGQPSNMLPLKAIGPMYEYFKKKPSTPLMSSVNCSEKHAAASSILTPVLQDFTMNRSALSKILLQVRDAIATAKNIPDKDSIACVVALARMVAVPPRNFDEFRSLGLDGFTIEKIYRFGPTFLNAVNKYLDGQLDMRSILALQPMIVQRDISPNLVRLIEAKKSKLEIVRVLNYSTDDQFFSDVEFLIQTGHQVIKKNIETLCNAHEIDFVEFRKNIDDAIMQASSVTQQMIREIWTNYHERTGIGISHQFIRLVIAYFKVRDYLNRLEVPYLDFDGNILQNAQKLLAEERIVPADHSFEVEEDVQPYRSRNVNVMSILDFFFGDCAFCDHNHNNDSFSDSMSDADYYDEFREYGDNGFSEYENEQGSESASHQGEEQKVEQSERKSSTSSQDDDSDSERSIDGIIAKRRRLS